MLLGLALGLVSISTSVATLTVPAPARAAQPGSALPEAAPAALTIARSSTGTPARAGAPTTTAGSPAAPAPTRYYVVGPPRDGQRDYLYQIAVQTLGDGNRYREIFELNRDRRQPDGGTLADPLTALRPGWILELPPDAKGAAVRVGPLPSPSEPRPSEPAAAEDGTSATPYLVGAAGLLVMAALLAVVLRLARGGHRPRPAEAAAPAEPETATPAEPETATPAAPETAAPAEPAESTEPAEATRSAEPTEVEPDDAKPRPVPRPEVAFNTDATGSPEVAATTVVVERPVSLLATSGRVVVQLESLADAPDRLDVRLLGSAPDGIAETPCAWIGDGRLPDAALPVVLGRQGERRLFVDLAAAPDVFTVTGVPSAARRQARAIAEQLRTAGATVIVVGDALGPDLPSGYQRLEVFPDADRAASAGPAVVFSGGLRGAELSTARTLADRTGRRAVPVLVGEVVRSRWSVRVTESTR
ncbi:hypothetical protein [Micromonospora sp. NPDC005367]|uniref:LysM peptidoglycan-binding domain-containing protein n=1 Tax=Micromonospora sp. NPDC005367 TaxID=3155590 RepID=UPI0033AB1062